MVLLVVWRFSCVVRFGLDVVSAASTPVCCTDCVKVGAGLDAVSILYTHKTGGKVCEWDSREV